MEVIVILTVVIIVSGFLIWCAMTYIDEPENFVGEHVDFSFVTIRKNYKTAYPPYVHQGVILRQSTIRRFLQLPWLQIYYLNDDGHHRVWVYKDLSGCGLITRNFIT